MNEVSVTLRFGPPTKRNRRVYSQSFVGLKPMDRRSVRRLRARILDMLTAMITQMVDRDGLPRK